MRGRTDEIAFPEIESAMVGGVRIARLDLERTAELMMDLASRPRRAAGPWFMTSVNGEVLARRRFDAAFARLLDGADLISADGQPLVMASRLLPCDPLPERIATTDLFPVAARKAAEAGVSFYLLGAREEVNLAAFAAIRRQYPRLDIRGRCHGYLAGSALERKLDEINALSPDILWLGLGVPREQEFVRSYAPRLTGVKIIKTSGGLFDFLSGARKRAPLWMQQAGLEWSWRLYLEPRRLFYRYLITNPVAMFTMLTQTRRSELREYARRRGAG